MAVKDRLVVAEVTVDVDVLATKFPEDRHVLVVEFEAVLGPVVRIIVEVDLAGDDHVDVLQEGEVQGGADEV